MNLLITGCCGHIGSYLVKNIHKIKNIKKTIIVDNLKSTQINSLFKSKKKSNLKFYNLDISQKNTLNKFKKIDYIIHLASMTNAEVSFKKKNEMYKNNIGCMKNIINFCKVNKCKLIHISSTSVYGKQSSLVDENCEKRFLKPQSPYAHIKLKEEQMLKKSSRKVKYITYRFGTISGVSSGMRFHTAVNNLSLKDAFKVFKFTIENDLFNNDIYNAVSENCTVKQILDKIKKFKKKIKIRFVYSKIMNQLSYHVDKKKLDKEGLYLNSKIVNDIKDTIKLLKNL